MTTEVDEIWTGMCEQLRRSVSGSTFEIWLAPLRARALSQSTLVLEAPPHVRGWVTDRFSELLSTSASSVLRAATTVEIVSATDPDDQCPSRASETPPGVALSQDLAFNPKLTFEQFVIGDANRMAHAAALSVAEMPAQAYNPLFLYGPPGLGKTHLLHSIANYVSTYGGGLTVRYTTAESFTNEFVHALQAGSMGGFKSRFRTSDVLLIDDVQFLERKARTEEEFFHTFNALYDAGSQLVLTSDRLPSDLEALEHRLRERFQAGLIADVGAPDRRTRLTILRKRVRHDHIDDVDPEALEVIADRISLNVRALEGALIRVVAYASLTHRPLTRALAEEVLDGLYPSPAISPRTIEEIQQATCDSFALTREELVGRGRSARVIWPRQVAMYLARELTEQSLPTIGRAFGRDHSTVLNACARADQRLSRDRPAFDAVQALTQKLST